MLKKRGDVKSIVLLFFSLSIPFTLFFILPSFVFGVNCWEYSDKTICKAATGCNWHEDSWSGGWCEQLGCWNYYTQSGCLDANRTGPLNNTCIWQSVTTSYAWCTEANCWNFEGTNRTACEENTDTYGLDCTWGPTNATDNTTSINCFGGSQCYGTNISNNETTCRNTTGCKWGSCWENGCWSYTTQSACNTDLDCYWTNYNYCSEISCWDTRHNSEASCNNATDTLSCKWNSQYNYCEQLNCWSFNNNQTGCQSTEITGLECTWNNPWCETKSCWQNSAENSCKGKSGYGGKNCTWQASTYSSSWCETVGCWSFDGWHSGSEDLCVNNGYGLTCAWETNTWGNSCYQNFTSFLSCSNVTDQKKCYDTMWCWWDSTSNQCKEPTAGTEGGAIGGNFTAPGCWIFDLNISSCTNTTGCAYDSTNRLCNINTTSAEASTIQSTGLNCTFFNNSNLCNSVTFLPYCCEWQGSCIENKFTTSCWDKMEKPPTGATYCEDYNAYSSEATCNNIANNPWYMPCRWDNNTKHCEFMGEKFFTQSEEVDTDLVDNKDMCEKGVGGVWLTESYCGTGNMTNASITIGRCATKVGAKGGNCDAACFKCEFKSDGSNHSSEATARDACESSELGFCVWKTDSTAPNRFGYCEASAEFKQGSVQKCDQNNCDACNSYNTLNAKTKCQEARCEWKIDPLDSTKGFCASSGTTTCVDRCDDCKEQQACVEKGRGVNGSCTWDTNLGLCKRSSTADNTGAVEICFDGFDNDGDAKVDCADGGCFSDPFCGGINIKDCWQYSNNESCFANDCRWFNDTYGGWCDQKAAVCWQYDGNAADCIGQSECQWNPAPAGSTMCNLNVSIWDDCAYLSQSDCTNSNKCYWFVDPYTSSIGGTLGWCGHRHEVCQFNNTLMSNQTACENANETIGGNLSCVWRYDPWAPNGGFCESSCFSLGNNCNDNPMCESEDGWCDPRGFGGNGSQVFNCFQFETQLSCLNQTNCNWLSDPNPICDISRITDCFAFSTSTQCNQNINCSWTGISDTDGWCEQKAEKCHWNMTLSMSQNECDADPDNLCYWKDWGGGYSSCEPNVSSATSQTQCNSLNGSWRSGWCDSASMVSMFTGMDMEAPPMPLGNDLCPETGIAAFNDICFFGMKDSKGNFGLGTGVSNIRDAALCNGVTTWQGVGSGNSTTKFYWYIDSDGRSSGGCALNSNSSSNGWDLYFRYESSFVNGSVNELKKAHRCISGEWKATDIKLSAWKEKMCNEIQGGMISIEKNDLAEISGLLNLSSTLRFYAATANSTKNESSPSDTIGPSYFTPGSIDFLPECCWGVGDPNIDCDNDGLAPANDPECFFMVNKGFIPFEDCFANSIDEDADGLTDCNDYDCKGNPYCVENRLGVEALSYVDNIPPKMIYWNIEKYSDSALLSFDTDEPANGSVEFYYNSSSCVNLNKTLYDVGIWHNITPNFKNWHDVEIYNDSGINSLNYVLSTNKTYFYKFKVCDERGNCAQSACSNFTTDTAANCKKCKFIFDMKLPSGWLLDLDLNTDDVYETALHRQCGSSSGILLNYTTARNVNLRLRDNSSNTTLFFLDARLTRSLSHNEKIRDIKDLSGIKNGTTSTTAGTTVGYAGLSKEVSNKLVDKFHPKSCMIQVDKGTGTCSQLYHCDDDLGNCVRRDTEAGVSLNETGPDYCIWKIPCIFSTYAGGAPGTPSGGSGSTGTSGGGGGGGGGGAVTASAKEEAYSSMRWDALASGSTTTFTINKEKIAIMGVIFDVKNTLANVDMRVASLTSNPTETPAAAKVYQYLQITKKNIEDKDASKITINFKVPKSWLTSNSVAEDNIILYRYESAWNKLQTAKTGSDANNILYKSTTPGFSSFAIGTKEAFNATPIVSTEEALPTTEAVKEVEAPLEEKQPLEEVKKKTSKLIIWILVSAIILVISVAGYQFWKRGVI